ncbi:MAG: TetR/AcrR family transcriptional regulator [Steroidobacteraceae bacterium]
MDTPESPPRGRGRPAGTRNLQRRRLLASACDLLLAVGAADLTLQQVARAAGVTPALAHYYFRNREGLLAAVIADRVAHHIEDLVEAARIRAGQPVAALTFLMQRTTSLLATEPLLRLCLWLPVEPARALRDTLRATLSDLLMRAQRAGLLRADLTAQYLCESLLGLVLFPFLEATRDADAGGERVAALTLQHVALLQDGIVRAQRPRQESAAYPNSSKSRA